jgi:hypothetical protein
LNTKKSRNGKTKRAAEERNEYQANIHGKCAFLKGGSARLWRRFDEIFLALSTAMHVFDPQLLATRVQFTVEKTSCLMMNESEQLRFEIGTTNQPQ